MNAGIVSLPEFICTTLKNNRAGGFITLRVISSPRPEDLSARAFAILCWLNALVLLIKLITVSTVCGKCGMLYAVTELISVVNTLPG